MGSRGPKPAPNHEKIAKGERRPSRVNYQEPDRELPASLKCPAGLDGHGKAEWNEQIKRLSERGILTDDTLRAFEDYCRAFAQLRAIEAKAKGVDLELAIQKGYVNAIIKLRAQVNTLRKECGLTPMSRGSVKAAKPAAPAKADPAARYLRALQGGKGA